MVMLATLKNKRGRVFSLQRDLNRSLLELNASKIPKSNADPLGRYGFRKPFSGHVIQSDKSVVSGPSENHFS